MLIEVRVEQYQNADSPMVVIVLGIIVFLHPATRVLVAVSTIALQLSRLSYIGLPFSTMIVPNDGHPDSTPASMFVTPLGIVIEARELQCQKTRSPIVVTLSGIAIEANSAHSQNALSPMLVTGPSKVITPWPSW